MLFINTEYQIHSINSLWVPTHYHILAVSVQKGFMSDFDILISDYILFW